MQAIKGISESFMIEFCLIFEKRLSGIVDPPILKIGVP